MNNSSSETTDRIRKRDQLRSFLSSRTKELYNYYNTPSPSRSISTPSLERTDTQEMDDIIQIPEIVQPQCIVFPTYGCHCAGDKYKIILAGWAFAKPASTRLDRFLQIAGRTYGGFAKDSDQDFHFSSLLNQFRCQTMRMTDIKLTLPGIIARKIMDSDLLSEQQKHKLLDYTDLVNTGDTGRFQKDLILDKEDLQVAKYFNVEATFMNSDQSFPGYIDLIEPHGISVISDIDDTIKITDILDGKDAILQNTFFRTSREVPHMSEVYRAWADLGAHFHYVSNSPWQVYPALSEFLITRQFPKGSMHLRAVSTQQLIRGKRGKHKIECIQAILQDFPERKFILVGDSGEIDPEVYREIYDMYPDQIIKIFIRDVSSERAKISDRIARDKPDSYFRIVRKFLTRESRMLRREGTSSQLAMDAMTETEVPEEQQHMADPNIPTLTKLEQFEDRMKRVSANMRDGVFSVFTLASQLMLDPYIAEEFLLSK